MKFKDSIHLQLSNRTFAVIAEEGITGVRRWLEQMNSARIFVVSTNSNSLSTPSSLSAASSNDMFRDVSRCFNHELSSRELISWVVRKLQKFQLKCQKILLFVMVLHSCTTRYFFIQSEVKPLVEPRARFFPRLASATCICFKDLFIKLLASFLVDHSDNFGFGLMTLHWQLLYHLLPKCMPLPRWVWCRENWIAFLQRNCQGLTKLKKIQICYYKSV